MQHQVTITIPDRFEPYLHAVADFNQFVTQATLTALQTLDRVSKRQRLMDAAKLMMPEYAENQELTSFTALDGEPLHE